MHAAMQLLLHTRTPMQEENNSGTGRHLFVELQVVMKQVCVWVGGGRGRGEGIRRSSLWLCGDDGAGGREGKEVLPCIYCRLLLCVTCNTTPLLPPQPHFVPDEEADPEDPDEFAAMLDRTNGVSLQETEGGREKEGTPEQEEEVR